MRIGRRCSWRAGSIASACGSLPGFWELSTARRTGDAASWPRIFANRDFFESLRLEPYYAFTAARVPAAAVFLDALTRDTRQIGDTLVHGDYSPKNILLHADRMVLLDHEVVHWGDPAFDLGFSMTHLLSKAHLLVDRRPAFADAARRYWQAYLDGASAA